MSNYKCLCELLHDNNLDLAHLVHYYVSYISVFYGIKIEEDPILKNKTQELQEYINGKIGENNV